MLGCLVVGALVAVAVMGGLAASKNNAQATTGSTAAPPATAQPTTTQRVTTTTQRVTTTTSRAQALAVLRSRVVLAPANGAARFSLGVPVTVHATGAHLERVHITGGPGTHVLAGAIDPYTGVFRSTGTLFPSTTYTVSFVVAGNVGTDTGLTAEGTRTFVTPAPSSAESVTANVFPTPGIAVGIGEPIIFMFSQPIDTYAAQQSVLSHLHISMSKPVPGGWHWFSSVELHFRPAHYWPVGEGVSVSGDLADWDVGGGNWGVGTLTTSFIIGESRISTVNLSTHQMTVTQNGKVLYTWPISGGRLADPSMDGTHIVMDRESLVDMNSATVGIPQGSPGAYNLKVYWDVHISDSGEYVHAGPVERLVPGFSKRLARLHQPEPGGRRHLLPLEPGGRHCPGHRGPEGAGNGRPWRHGLVVRAGRGELDAGQSHATNDVCHHAADDDDAAAGGRTKLGRSRRGLGPGR